MGQFFICGEEQVKTKVATLTHTGGSESPRRGLYLDKATNEVWELVHYCPPGEGGIISALKLLPDLTARELIDLAVTALNRSDIIGASYELSARERKKECLDFRATLVDELMQLDRTRLDEFEKRRLRTIISKTGLSNPVNRRDVVGKHFTEIQQDADYFQLVAQKANDILNDVERNGE